MVSVHRGRSFIQTTNHGTERDPIGRPIASGYSEWYRFFLKACSVLTGAKSRTYQDQNDFCSDNSTPNKFWTHMKSHRFAALGIVLLMCGFAAATAQTAVARDKLLEKVDPQVVQGLAVGIPQDVTVLVDVRSEKADIAKRALRYQRENSASNNVRGPTGLTGEQERAFNREEKNATLRVKEEIFSNKFRGRVKVIVDYPSIPIIRVLITDTDAMMELLRHPRVLDVAKPKIPVKQGKR